MFANINAFFVLDISIYKLKAKHIYVQMYKYKYIYYIVQSYLDT